jgi:two-component system phosphate regulon sensor histidine kinase PhoR
MPRGLAFELSIFAAAALAAVALALAGVNLGTALLLTLLPLVARHSWHLIRLERLVRRQHRLVPPFPLGLWGEIYRTIGRYQQRGRKGRKRQLRFFRRFREAVNSVPDALVVLDKNRRIEWANPGAQLLMNLHWPRDNGKPLNDVFQQPELASYIIAGDYGRPLEVAPTHNRSIMLSIRVAPFGERKKQRLVVGRDITKVFHLNEIRRDFVANASHELRTPLTVITGFLEALVDSPQAAPAHRRPLSLMQNQAERMRRIIEDLLALSRLEMSDEVRDASEVDVPYELEQIITEARALSPRHCILVDIEPELRLLGKDSELRSAFSNLVFNAVKHTPPDTRIEVSWTRTLTGPVFSVRDDGPGIAPEHLPRLTERFYRVDKARSRESGGTGLGLAIVKHALSRHDARLAISSEPGAGATFTCYFPARIAIADAAVAKGRPRTVAIGAPAEALHAGRQRSGTER